MKLILPTAEYTEQIRAYRQELLDSGSSMDGTGALREIADPDEWLRWTEACTSAETVPEPGFVPATQYIFVADDGSKIAGMIQIRHYSIMILPSVLRYRSPNPPIESRYRRSASTSVMPFSTMASLPLKAVFPSPEFSST